MQRHEVNVDGDHFQSIPGKKEITDLESLQDQTGDNRTVSTSVPSAEVTEPSPETIINRENRIGENNRIGLRIHFLVTLRVLSQGEELIE